MNTYPQLFCNKDVSIFNIFELEQGRRYGNQKSRNGLPKLKDKIQELISNFKNYNRWRIIKERFNDFWEFFLGKHLNICVQKSVQGTAMVMEDSTPETNDAGDVGTNHSIELPGRFEFSRAESVPFDDPRRLMERVIVNLVNTNKIAVQLPCFLMKTGQINFFQL